MSDRKFNLSRYRELLEIQNQRSLAERDQVLLDDSNYLELMHFRATIYNQISLNRIPKYYSLMQDYLKKKISLSKFMTEFSNMKEEDEEKASKLLDDFLKLSNFEINSNIDKFGYSFLRISNNCRRIIEFGLNNPEGISKDEFINSIQKFSFHLQDYMDEDLDNS